MDNLTGKRVLVTGAAGFVGANLIRELMTRGAEIHALLRTNSNLWRLQDLLPHLAVHQVDLADSRRLRNTVSRIQPDVVFHLATQRAASSFQERLLTLQTNIVGTFNLLEATALLPELRFVYAGSSLEYGARKRALKESARPEPTVFFGAAKAASTLLCQQFARANRRPLVILRFFSIYGYWEPPTHLIPTAMRAALRGRALTITDRAYRRDFLFIEDAVRACLLAARAKEMNGDVMNIGAGKQWSNNQIVKIIQTLAGRPIKVRVGAHPAREWDTLHWVADIRKAKQKLGWKPQYTLRGGLEKMLAWFRLHQEHYGQ